MKRGLPLPGILRLRAVRLSAGAALFTAAYGALAPREGRAAWVMISDGIFYIGLIYLVVGMAFYVHNIGLFKTFRYWGYRLAYNRRAGGGRAAHDARPMDLVAFTQHILSLPRRPTGAYLLFGAGLMALSALVIVLSGGF